MKKIHHLLHLLPTRASASMLLLNKLNKNILLKSKIVDILQGGPDKNENNLMDDFLVQTIKKSYLGYFIMKYRIFKKSFASNQRNIFNESILNVQINAVDLFISSLSQIFFFKFFLTTSFSYLMIYLNKLEIINSLKPN